MYQRQPLRCVLVLLALVLLPFRPAIAAEGNANDDGIVVMISVDGLANFYFDDPKAETPTLHALAADGAHAAQGMLASTPSVTWPNHTTLVTGVPPARHGVVGNNYFDRATGKRVVLISDPVYDKVDIVKVPTIYDQAKAAGMTTAAIRWPASRNAPTLDWTMPDIKGADMYAKYTTPSLIAECKQAGCWIDGVDTEDAKVLDALETRIFNMILHQHRPRLALLHVINVDHTQHDKGPRSAEAYAVIKDADAQVKEVWDELQRDFPGKATLFVVSDHGFSPIHRAIFPNVILRQAGLIKTSVNRVTSGSVQLVPQGGCAMLYIDDQLDATKRADVVQRVQAAFQGVEGVAKIVDPAHTKDYGVADPKDDPHAPDMLLFADLGYQFGDTAAGDLPFHDKPERLGTHGHDPHLPDLHATFIAWGRGVDKGVKLGEISNLDVAPTLAQMLKIELPKAEGKPLSLTATR